MKYLVKVRNDFFEKEGLLWGFAKALVMLAGYVSTVFFYIYIANSFGHQTTDSIVDKAMTLALFVNFNMLLLAGNPWLNKMILEDFGAIKKSIKSKKADE